MKKNNHKPCKVNTIVVTKKQKTLSIKALIHAHLKILGENHPEETYKKILIWDNFQRILSGT